MRLAKVVSGVANQACVIKQATDALSANSKRQNHFKLDIIESSTLIIGVFKWANNWLVVEHTSSFSNRFQYTSCLYLQILWSWDTRVNTEYMPRYDVHFNQYTLLETSMRNLLPWKSSPHYQNSCNINKHAETISDRHSIPTQLYGLPKLWPYMW